MDGIIVIVSIIVAILNIILFFKIWNACNNIQLITNRFVFGNTSLQPIIREYKAGDTYIIGDIVRKNGEMGVVFEVTDDGKHGKMVSVRESSECLKWSSDSNEQKRLIGANNENGVYNMQLVKQVDDWQSKYPAFAWCAYLGEDWYLPTKEELVAISRKRKTIDKSLESINAETLSVYWTSMECSNDCAWLVSMNNGNTCSLNKFYDNNVRAVSAF